MWTSPTATRYGSGARWSAVFCRGERLWPRNREALIEFRPFGRTGLKVSAIGFGCWEIGGTYGRIDESLFQRAVAQAIDSGINCFDTAEALWHERVRGGAGEGARRPPQ